MLDVTDRHCRYFLRLLAPGVRLYTEMITAQAVVRGNREKLLAFDAAEHPVAVQLAGRDPAQLAQAALIAADFGYDEVNLNVGCPSQRVQDGGFGVCLMLEPEVVARCVAAMRAVVAVPVTVKVRTGIDQHDDYEFFSRFVAIVAEAGCTTFIVHARKAVSKGLSPRANMTVPPLRHEFVYRLREERPELRVILNGGVRSIEAIEAHLLRVDGVMLGRKAAEDPYFLTEVQQRFFAGTTSAVPPGRAEIVRRMSAYAQHELGRGTRLREVTRHMLGLYRGVPGARRWRRLLSELACAEGASADLLLRSTDFFRGSEVTAPSDNIQSGRFGYLREIDTERGRDKQHREKEGARTQGKTGRQGGPLRAL
jgi:tRNA-dihydrouridine synthase A